MFNVGEEVIIKTLDDLLKNNDLVLAEDLKNVYCNKDKKYVVFPDFNYFGTKCTVDTVDEKDPDIPYFVSLGIWVPEFMIEGLQKPKPVEPPVKAKEENPAAAMVAEKADDPVEIFINKFSNKPFGKMFVKLIKLDAKIAEFSSTSFSKLKKHELQYIAKILQDNGRQGIDYNKATQKELSVYCYTETLGL